MDSYTLEPVGFIRSPLKRREEAPRQRAEGAPDAWLEIESQFAEALLGMEVGHELIVITWLHEATRDILKGYPRSNTNRQLTGGPIEVFDGTPVVDIKSASTSADG